MIIVNNPCLEFWLLLHFEATSKYFDTCEGAEKQLKDYEKTQKQTNLDSYSKNNNSLRSKRRASANMALCGAVIIYDGY